MSCLIAVNYTIFRSTTNFEIAGIFAAEFWKFAIVSRYFFLIRRKFLKFREIKKLYISRKMFGKISQIQGWWNDMMF